MRGLTLKPGIGVTADAYRGDLFRGRQVTFIAVSAAIAVATLSLTPFLYMFVAFPFEAWTELDHHHFAHIGLLVFNRSE